MHIVLRYTKFEMNFMESFKKLQRIHRYRYVKYAEMLIVKYL